AIFAQKTLHRRTVVGNMNRGPPVGLASTPTGSMFCRGGLGRRDSSGKLLQVRAPDILTGKNVPVVVAAAVVVPRTRLTAGVPQGLAHVPETVPHVSNRGVLFSEWLASSATRGECRRVLFLSGNSRVTQAR
ncbi:unnamed protein product, partial [Ectocarpus sp. 13 AM-2016]